MRYGKEECNSVHGEADDIHPKSSIKKCKSIELQVSGIAVNLDRQLNGYLV